MSTRSYLWTLIAVTALVFAAPAATAESSTAQAPDDTERVAAGAPAPTAAPAPDPEPAAASSAEPTQQATPDPTAQAAQQPTPDPIPEPPAGPTPAPANGGAGCFLTSAGLICPSDPACVVTSAGVTCASNCIVTSAGLSCPRGDVVPNPQGEVLSNPPVSGGPERTPTPTRKVKSERKDKPTRVPRAEARELPTGARVLPFTGEPALPWLGLGCALLAGGLLLRRWSSSAGAAVELAGEVTPLAALPGPPPRARRLPSQPAIVLPALALVVCGLLLRRRTRAGGRMQR